MLLYMVPEALMVTARVLWAIMRSHNVTDVFVRLRSVGSAQIQAVSGRSAQISFQTAIKFSTTII